MIKIYLHDHRDHIELNASGGFIEVRATLNSLPDKSPVGKVQH